VAPTAVREPLESRSRAVREPFESRKSLPQYLRGAAHDHDGAERDGLREPLESR
jgi:hypothetical protein